MKSFKSKLGSTKSKKKQVNEHENELAQKLNGFRQPNSGAFEQHKGDIKLERFLLDSKESAHNSILISAKDFTKITRESDGEFKRPGLVITIEGLPMSVEKEWICIPLSVFAEMLECGLDEKI